MKNLLLKFYKTYKIKDKIFKEWIIKDSLVVLIDKKGKIQSIFPVTKNNRDHIDYYKVSELDLYSLTFASNYSISKKSDSNNEYSFMFKKEKELNKNIEVLENYKKELLKKLNITQDPAIEMGFNKLLKKEEFLNLKPEAWVKIFLDTDISNYIKSHKRYIESRGNMEIFLNRSDNKKPFLSKKATVSSKNTQSAEKDELDALFFVDKFFYLSVKTNKRHIYFDNKDSNNINFLNFKEAKNLLKFTGYYMEVEQDKGVGVIKNFSCINKKEYSPIKIYPLYFTDNLETIKYEYINTKDFLKNICVFFKKDNCRNYKNIEYHLTEFTLKGIYLPFNSLKEDFLKIIELSFFNSKRSKGNSKLIKNQLNIFNTIYKEGKMENNSFLLGKIIRYLETKKTNGYGEFRNNFRDMSFKNAQDNLEKLEALYRHNIYKCKKYKKLQEDISKILNVKGSERINNIDLLKGYLEDISYYDENEEVDDEYNLCSQK